MIEAARELSDAELLGEYESKHKARQEFDAEAIRMLGNRLLVKVDRDPNKVEAGGVIIEVVRRDRPKLLYGTVVAVGPGRWLSKAKRYEPIDIEASERVCFRSSKGWAEFESSGREHVILTLEQVEGVCDSEQ